MNQVRSLPSDISVGVQTAALRCARRRSPTQPEVLEIGSQLGPNFQVDFKLGVPRRASRRRTVHVKIAVVATYLEKGLKVSLFPSISPPSHPHSHLAVAEKVLGPGRKTQIRLGALTRIQSATDQAQRLFVDLSSQRAAVSSAHGRTPENTWGGGVAEIGFILGGNSRRDKIATGLCQGARDTGNRCFGPPDPGGTHQPKAIQCKAGYDIGCSRVRRRHNRQPPASDQA